MKKIRIVSDIHGKVTEYKRVIKDSEYSLQLGDFGIGYPGIECEDLGPNHKFFHGNHDCPVKCIEHPNGLERYGIWNGIFYVAGAWTPPHLYNRWPYKNWWPDEQLCELEMSHCRKMYSNIKPDIVVTHDCPTFIKDEYLAPKLGINCYETATDLFLEELFHDHQPKLWIFGHWHFNLDVYEGNTRFICMEECKYYDVDS